MKIGVGLGMLHPALFEEVAVEADRLGFESLWLPEHLIFTQDMSGSPHLGDDLPPVPPTTPVFDAFAMLAYLAGRTKRIRLGTNVYLLGLRHPFVAARAVQTLDVVSRGRAEVGIGAGWLREEWQATGLDPATRGRRLDEALVVCRRLWTEEVVSHSGEFYQFDPVVFEPKPVQRPHPPIHVGGESRAALARAARAGNGWLGLSHDAQSVRAPLRLLGELRAEAGRADEPFEVIVGASDPAPEALAALAAAGVTRVIVKPWRRSREAVAGLRAFAARHGIEAPEPAD